MLDEGDYRDDLQHGKGRYKYSEGDVYEGDFRHGKKNGHGKATFTDGDQYEGAYRDDKMHGYGKYRSGGNIYEGMYEMDMMSGRGKFTYSDGAIFEGMMLDDEKEGPAIYRWPDGGAIAAIRYVKGEPAGEGARISADRKRAYRLESGKKQERIPLEDAYEIATRLGLQI